MRPEEVRELARRRYALVAAAPEGQFPYPIGRESAERLGYAAAVLDRIPGNVTARFVGVGNPFSLGAPTAGWRVVDIGCGAGLDSRFAAHWVGAAGQVIGVDLSPEMLAVARAWPAPEFEERVRFAEGDAESLPVESGWADLVISNGVLNLTACKERAFAEIARVLRPGGRLQAVDLVLVEELPESLRNDQFAWSG